MKIPIIQATEPKAVVTPIYPGRVEREIGGLATESQRLIDTIVTQKNEIREKFKDADDLLMINKNKNDFKLFYQDWDKELDEDPDQLNRDFKFAERANKKKEEVLSSIPDKLLNKKAQLALDNQMVGMIIVQGDKGRKREGEKIVGTAEKQILDAANMGDFDTVKNTIQKIVDIGLKDESWKVQQTANAQKISEEARLINLYKNDPAAAVLAIDKGKFPSLNQKELATYKVAAQEREIVLRDRLEKDQNKKIVDDTYKELKEKFGSDYPMMLKKLYDVNYQKEKGITAPLANQVENYLKSEWTTNETEKTKRHEANSAKLFVNLGKTPIDEINGMVSRDEISWQQGEHFKNAVISPLEMKMNDAGLREYLNIDNLIDTGIDKKTGTRITREQIEGKILLSKNIPISDKKVLANKLTKEVFADPWFKQASEDLKTQTGYQGGLIGTWLNPKGAENYRKGISQLMDQVEKEGLRGKTIFDREQELVFPLKIDTITDMLKMNTIKYEDKGKIYNIPIEQEEAFLKDHPKARKLK